MRRSAQPRRQTFRLPNCSARNTSAPRKLPQSRDASPHARARICNGALMQPVAIVRLCAYACARTYAHGMMCVWIPTGNRRPARDARASATVNARRRCRARAAMPGTSSRTYARTPIRCGRTRSRSPMPTRTSASATGGRTLVARTRTRGTLARVTRARTTTRPQSQRLRYAPAQPRALDRGACADRSRPYVRASVTRKRTRTRMTRDGIGGRTPYPPRYPAP